MISRLALLISLMFLGFGCHKYPNKVSPPPISVTVAEGKQSLHYKVETPGTIYLERVKRHQFLWQHDVKPGDEVILDLDTLQLWVNSQPQRDVKIKLASYRLVMHRN